MAQDVSESKDYASSTLGQNRDSRTGSGPRSLFVRRSENGFGFTLRHFIVYPPESYLVLAGDERLGLRRGACVRPDEPMDTIFVKHIRENGPACVAGLNTGDRIISVNGETVAGKSYAHVVQLIQQTPCYLHLLVVPMENDILQLYFSETAHNPETNQRPGRLKTAMTSGSELRFHRGRDSSPIYQNAWGRSASKSSAAARFVSPHRTPSTRRSSAAESSGSYRNKAALLNPKGRHSMDVGVACRDALLTAESHHPYVGHGSSTSAVTAPDDSVLISRLKKSLEQKEEFLRRPVVQTHQAKEFYSRPQKLAPPQWPPNSLQQSPPQSVPAGAGPVPEKTAVATTSPSPVTATASKPKGKQFVNILGKISEDAKKPTAGSVPVEAAADHLKQTNSQVVSMRAKQFESGKIDDKTDFYRSELARLSSKHNVPNVAVRKMEYEQKLSSDKKQQHDSKEDVLSSCSSDKSCAADNEIVPYHSGNLIVPIGSTKIHCEPPKESESSKEESSVSKDESYRFKPVVRQDSYLAACKKPTIIERRSQRPVSENGDNLEKKNHRRFVRPTRLELPKDRPVNFALQSSGSSQVSIDSLNDNVEQPNPSETATAAVTLRTNLIGINDEERTTRRISYLKATAWGDRMSVDDLTTTEYESEPSPIVVIQQNKLAGKKSCPGLQYLGNSSVVKEGSLLCKIIQIDGKKTGDRSWKPVWAVVRGQTLCLYKDKQRESLPNISAVETPAVLDKTEDVNMSCDRINLMTTTTAVAQDYVKRKHVMRLNSNTTDVGYTEILLQADDTSSMVRWLKALQEQALEVPSAPSAEECASVSPGNTKGIRKLATFRNRSPTGDSPITKTRKPDRSPSQIQPQSPKSTNTWKNRMAKQLKKIQQGSGSPVSPVMPSLPPPPGTSIGVPLELCPPSTQSEFVPLIVEVCTSIVEDKGLDIVGIYRVPGNTAAITSLTEAVNNGGMETPDMALKLLQRDPRWTDVNVISSLLKSFFRRLPEALLTTEMYSHFIEADKIDDPVQRMVKLRELIHKLPEHHFETLKYLLMHLKKVVQHSGVNKMEARNLAIVFGPTLVHSADNNMVTMVTDMSHQCRIVESLILQADWCYGNGDVADLKASIPENCGQVPEIEQSAPNQNLLDNINKVSGNQYSTPFLAKDLVSNIVAAANRKMHRATSKNSNLSRKSRSNTNTVVPLNNTSSTTDVKQELSDKEKLNSSKASSETVSTTSLNESEDSLDRLQTSYHSSISSTNVVDGGAPIKSYVNLNETTQERIRKFEQETKAMLQREISRGQRRREYFGVNEPVGQPSQALLLAKDYPPIMVKVSKGTLNNGISFDQTKNETDSNSNQKRLKTSNNTADDWSSDSVNDISRVSKERPSSHASDEGGDLLVSLTSAFDKKLKSLSVPNDTVSSVATPESVDNNQTQHISSKSDEEKTTDAQPYRDPSLHRSLERHSQHITEKHEIENLKDSTSETVKDSSPQPEIPNHFECLQDVNANSNVRLRRSESLKQKENRPEYGNHVKLRRCESLNKHERYTQKYTKFEVMMLTKNGDASKHRRSDLLTKTEKTESNMNKRKQGLSRRCSSLRDKEARQKRKNGVIADRSIKRRHTVGGTKDFDKITWLDNKEKEELENSCKERRTSSPDLSWARVVGGLKEMGIRPRSMADPNYLSKLLNVPLESHV